VIAAIALAERLITHVDTADRAMLKHMATDLEVELARIKVEREMLIEENNELLKRKSESADR
jgi:hypothetical protein